MMSHKKTIHPIDVVLKKRDGLELSDEEIRAFLAGVVDESVTPARIAALLMAIFQRGMSSRELATLTDAMRRSGEVFDSRFLKKFTVDKHSTGGVGDKSSLLIAPIVAAAGLADPMISGRSLGHTGGTLDKLETIPGFNTQLSLQQFGEVIAACGFSMIGQTKNLVPADRILYALRDHTGTVESPYLITASIMSKKLAEGLDGLVLDVKTGSGAFMKKFEDSEHLARLMVSTGESNGTRTVAVLTTMDEPLGRFSGNWVEVWECIDIMRGVQHPMYADLIELSVVLAGWMLFLGGVSTSAEAGKERAAELLQDGSAYEKFVAMTKLQGGDVSVFEDPAAFHKPAATRVLTADRDGFLAGMDCTEVGWAVQRLGAGREVPGGPVAAHAGIEMHAKIGDRITKGQPLVTLFTEDASLLETPERMLRETIVLADRALQKAPLVRQIITA
ncbi:thymidine phosphorylase [Terriglobus roseus DSM 18391]|uniref:thymidine phosphorylase n=1 Tax=Terriglobus roseus (strain DSM 18391 / NRRL B-41598 / KBS 63) TaxID=926566 RepID=I3ZCT7_TERRK|nr:thymidine phosphorylase [Terriglobus roseus]AFL87055.1 thymidine phosphorylase [Terriglobus roseus DSM 18391]